jgi:glycosyltransferase involved in cell wall biosynthesis
MRILHIESGMHLYGGGAQVRYLIEGLHAEGVDNVLVCARGGALAAAPLPATIVEAPMSGDLDAGLIARLARTIRDLTPDLVHVHSRRGADLFGGLAARLARVPAVLTRRVDSAEPKLVMRLKYRAYRRVIAISSAVAVQLEVAGVERGRIALIRSAVDTERFRPDGAARARLRGAFGLPADSLAVGVVAQLIPRKGHRTLLTELPALVKREPRARVILFGRGPLERELRALVERLGVAEHVSFAGFRGDLAALLPGLDVLVHPAEREGLGVALLEAAAAGVPAVACAAGGVPEVVADGRTGLLVPPGDGAALRQALERLLHDPEQRRALGAAARVRVERGFSVAALAAEHVALYSEVLQDGQVPTRRLVGGGWR